MSVESHGAWAIVLAGGEGSRLRPLTARLGEERVPKQYWSLGSGGSLLRRAIERSTRVVTRDRILVVVAADHREWWKPELEDLPSGNVIVQPEGRGTAAGILLPLLRIWLRDPFASVVVVPSDHHVELEGTFAWALHRALARLRETADRLVLLGMTAESADPGYGWIVPGAGSKDAVRAVARFAEKPPSADAERLRQLGALVNTFVFAAQADGLMRLYERHLPELTRLFRAALGAAEDGWDRGRLEALYRVLPCLDFSRDLLEAAAPELSVLPVPYCGWTDLGTPERVEQCLARSTRTVLLDADPRPLDLASAFPGRRTGGDPAPLPAGHAVFAGHVP